jgi:uncharacterized membrane protein
MLEAEADTEQRDATRETGRLEAFSDGVFAIAATLLVLDLKVSVQTPGRAQTGLLSALLDQGTMFLAFAMSFAFILIMWVNHHNMFRVIRRTDHIFLLLNGLLLLFITFVPFPTALLATYTSRPNQTVAAVVYNGTYVVIALAFNALWWYASYKGRLLDRRLVAGPAQSITRRYRFGPLMYLACVGLAFFNAYASLALNVLLAVYFAWPHTAPATARASMKGPAESA